MTTTSGTLWARNKPSTSIRWWNPPERSGDGFNVQYKEGDELDWVKKEELGTGHGTVVESVELGGAGGDEVAMKKFALHGGGEVARNTAKESMYVEIKAIRRLNHIHVVEIIGSAEFAGGMGFFMLPCAAHNLAELLDGLVDFPARRNELENYWGKKLPYFLVSTIGCLAHALRYIHENSVKHKDIKPANILVDEDRVVLADFGLSRTVEESVTTSTGITGRTKMYAPLEVLRHNDGDKRSSSQDIFSLGCCFVEIFAAYKGRSPDDVIRTFGDCKQEHRAYAYHVPKILKWMKQELVEERCDIQLWNLVRQMLARDRRERPRAKTVWEETVTMSSGAIDGLHFCGACCMPIVSDTLSPPQERPSSLKYMSKSGNSPSRKSELAKKDASFTTCYTTDELDPYTWSRNLRIMDQAALEAVQSRSDPWLSRKIIWPSDESDSAFRKALDVATAEAKLLERVHTPTSHPHIVSLHGTYRLNRNPVLLILPLATFDLKAYLSLVGRPRMEQLADALNVERTLRISFGCLANAVKHIHAKGIVHGDIQSRNILVMPSATHSICLAEFGMATHKEHQRDVPSTKQDANGDESYHMNENRSRTPEKPRPQTHDYAEDVFSLGCIFLEIETVRKNLSLQEMWDFLAGSTESGNAAVVQYWDNRIIDLLPVWAGKLRDERGTVPTLASVMARMVAREAAFRPAMDEVLMRISQCEEAGGVLCGSCCLSG